MDDSAEHEVALGDTGRLTTGASAEQPGYLPFQGLPCGSIKVYLGSEENYKVLSELQASFLVVYIHLHIFAFHTR